MHANSNPADRRGLLVVGHGTRDPAGQAEFRAVVELIQERLESMAVEPAYLELARPTIAEAVDALAARGARELTVLPLLLFAAGHAQQDIPLAVREAVSRHSGMRVRQAPHLGCASALIELSALRFDEALSREPLLDPADAVLLFVGRGSHDPTANAEMFQFSRLRWESRGTGWLEVAFTAMTRPTLEEGLAICRDLPHSVVIVQPHLLFQGELLARIAETVKRFEAERSDKRWLVVGHLGPHELLAEAAIGRAGSPGDPG